MVFFVEWEKLLSDDLRILFGTYTVCRSHVEVGIAVVRNRHYHVHFSLRIDVKMLLVY